VRPFLIFTTTAERSGAGYASSVVAKEVRIKKIRGGGERGGQNLRRRRRG
jgi:hypothetical protein